MFGIGGWEMLLIGVVALLVFGPKRLPELARSMGKGLAEFRRASSDLRRSIDFDLDPTHLSAPDPESQPPAQAGEPAVSTPLSKPVSEPTPLSKPVSEPTPLSKPVSEPTPLPEATLSPVSTPASGEGGDSDRAAAEEDRSTRGD